MLSRILLKYSDEDLQARYIASRIEFYKKAYPLLTVLILLLAIALQVTYIQVSSDEFGKLSVLTSVINWVAFGLFLLLSLLVRRFTFPIYLVCPLLTLLSYYYFAFVDFQRSAAVLYFT
jgi:hypothetical protein